MVTINLLPRKKRLFTASHIVLSGIGLTWVAAASFLWLTYGSTNESVTLLKQEIKMKETAIAALQKQAVAVQADDSLDQYVLFSERMQQLFLPTNLLMDEIAHALPEHGRLDSIKYSLSGSIELEGSFEQYEDVAAYLHNLQASPYVVKAEVTSIKAREIKWQGPVDDQGKPLSAILSTVGGKLLPRYTASLKIKAITVDLQELVAKEQAAATGTAEVKK
ncbi:PilN domain-containing protein [Brevibacillus agri]|uniref:PilN domain-containing protein n=1 Tax=Brevibacillus agri TaxID=51101 RepID=UPI001EE51F9E|nr:PilN domain-containing protein [Brevibacillus agri]MCG5254039.1 PilN domain-containing protein [Brevibacillus agri]MDN4096154.1 PilN domain-containing protein [Brevibacillus agri]MED1824742.1 PilN domain-containing protein [Brevibacillus agri]